MAETASWAWSAEHSRVRGNDLAGEDLAKKLFSTPPRARGQ